ncbi:major facilitator superfamily domain-containing protein 1 [Drosophila subpulchrella]|uniref:major facilitator superfamily domain-containing protein 1 n=1 Tax=Drosophila subpulchrella TaxID=1486046 RepID=UPI0018A183D2|nr:major facilitator superfamily domain-containing protein 1 [Drosophila subpulchrella]XP_037718951.1 major facilitator superfamily domain-containing protein 1 [Drosophila subpulchrella]
MAREDEERIVDNEEVSHPTEEDAVAGRGGARRDNELSLPSGGCCMPSSTGHRFMALVFMCLLGFGSYFCYDNPGALQNVFKRDLGLTSTQFTLIYSIYSWPNVVLCFVGGFLIDRLFGIRLGTIIYMLILLVGQLIFAFGGILDAFWMMILGRFIFGIGAESLAVAQNSYAVLWFKGKELNMVFGLQLSVARFGSTVNFWVMQPIYDYVSNFYKGHTALGVVLLLATLTCVMSMICALILGWMDKRAERILQRNTNPAGQVPKLTDVFSFKPPFWMVSVICVAYYVAIFPFIALGQKFFVDRFGFTPAQANTVDSLVYLIAAVSSPVFGFIIDKLGRNVAWVFTATLTTIGAHALLTFTQLTPYVGMVIMGLSYSMLAASLWPLVALIIPEYQLGTAYGFCQSIQNLGLAVITILAGIISDKSKGEHMWLQLFFMGWLTLALIATGVMWAYNNKHRGNLNMTPRQRAQFVSAVNYQNFE